MSDHLRSRSDANHKTGPSDRPKSSNSSIPRPRCSVVLEWRLIAYGNKVGKIGNKAKEKPRNYAAKSSGGKGIRTPDLLHAMETRYQLRHTPVFCFDFVSRTGSTHLIYTHFRYKTKSRFRACVAPKLRGPRSFLQGASRLDPGSIPSGGSGSFAGRQ